MNIDQSMKVSLKCKEISFSLQCNKAQLAFAEVSLSGFNNYTNLDFKSNQFFIFLPTNIYKYKWRQKVILQHFQNICNEIWLLWKQNWANALDGRTQIPFTFWIFHFTFYILQPPHSIPTLPSLIELSSLKEQHNLWLFILLKTINVDRW